MVRRHTFSFDIPQGVLLIACSSCPGMVGETVEWQEAHVVDYKRGTVTQVKLDNQVQEVLLKHLAELEQGLKEFGSMPGMEGLFKTAKDYADYLSRSEIDELKQLAHLLTPEGQQEQHNSMNAEAISLVK